MKKTVLQRIAAIFLSAVLLISSFCIFGSAQTGYDADFSAAWGKTVSAAQDQPQPLTLTLDITKTTTALLFDNALLASGDFCCLCEDGSACADMQALSAKNVRIRFDENDTMLTASFFDDSNGICAKLTPTKDAVVGKTVSGAIYLQNAEHRTQDYYFAVSFSGQWGTVQKNLPDYTLTRSDSTAIAGSATQWNSTPAALEISLQAREKFEIALCTDYWANTATSGYNATPRLLSATFTQGEGLLDFYIHIGASNIWGGASCELLTVVPTDDAYSIKEPTTVSGEIELYWTGYTTMPFTITLLPSVPAYSETQSTRTDIALAATGWNLTPPSLEETIGAREKRTLTLCSSYWANTATSGYNSQLRLLSKTVSEGSDLLDFYVSIGAGTIWGGAEAELLTIVPKEAAYSITQPTTVSGTVSLYWTNWTTMEYTVTVLPYVPDTPTETVVFEEVLNSDTSCCNDDWAWTGAGDSIAALPSGTIEADEIYVAPVCSNYWTYWDQPNYSTQPTLTSATIATGRDLVTVSLRERSESSVWGGSECIFAEITPTENARSITEDTVVSGTFHMKYRPWYANCTVPFSVTLKKATADLGTKLSTQAAAYVQSVKTSALKPLSAVLQNADLRESYCVLLGQEIDAYSITVGKDYATLLATQNVLTVTPTAKAKAELLLGKELTVRGSFTVGTAQIPFEFTLTDSIQAPQYELDHLYSTQKALYSLPATMQAELVLPKNQQSVGGVIFGDYIGVEASFTFGIAENGVPRLFYQSERSVYQEVLFSDVHVNTGDPVKLAVTKSADTFRCYVDGVLMQTVEKHVPDVIPENEFVLGGDLREGNTARFTGVLRNVALYCDVRTDTEIANSWIEKDDLLCAYRLEGQKNTKIISDIAGNYDLQYDRGWIDPSEVSMPADYAYSIAVLGDIQKTTYYYPEQLHTSFDWIVDHQSEHKISYVIGLGDTTDGDTPAEWALTRQMFGKFENKIPYQVVRGNHDSTVRYNQYFSTGANAQNAVCKAEGSYENNYRLVKLGNTDYMFMQLDYGASDEVLAWAGDCIAKYPDYKVIITTHAYAYVDGTTQDDNDHVTPTSEGFPNNGDDYWEKLVKKYSNIEMVLCGHEPDRDVISFQTKGDHDNVVTQLLIDPQSMDMTGPKGMICMLYFSEDGTQMDIRWYSSVRDQYYQPHNQRRISLTQIAKPSATYHAQTKQLTVTNVPQNTQAYVCGYWKEQFVFMKIMTEETAIISDSFDCLKVLFLGNGFVPSISPIIIS